MKIEPIDFNDQFIIIKKQPLVQNINAQALVDHRNNILFNLYSCLTCIINSDILFETQSITRLIYPHLEGRPCISTVNSYFIKLIVNGTHRCIAIDGIINKLESYSKDKEVYPFFIQKAFTKIYSDRISNIDPNILIYRLIGWIPENINIFDIGSCDESFDKLHRNFMSFTVMLSFCYKGQILPILGFESDNKIKKIKTLFISDKKSQQGSLYTGKLITVRFCLYFKSC